MANIDYYLEEYKDRISRMDNENYKISDSVPDVRNMINDHKVMAMAKDLEKKVIGDVVIIHDDVDFSVYDGKAIKIDDYVAKRSKLIDYTSIIDLDMEFDHLEYFQKIVSTLDLSPYLPDGMTLLISTIKCNDPEKIEERDGRRIPDQKVIKKIRFLLESGADPNKNDNGRYCLPPLAHSIQTREHYGFDIFKILFEAGCDFNKAARDERTASYMKVRKLNEGNTPLMIACFHAKKKFVKMLCEKDAISLNQQDSNGYKELYGLYCCGSFDKTISNVEYYKQIIGHYPTFNATVGKGRIENASKVIEFFKPPDIKGSGLSYPKSCASVRRQVIYGKVSKNLFIGSDVTK